MSFGPDFDIKERVRESTDIADLIGRYVELRPQGRKFVGLCPFHEDRHPSLQINPEFQSWKCWVCNVGGDAFSFVMQREGVDFPEALKILADRAGIELGRAGRDAGSRGQSGVDKSTLYQAMQWAAEQFQSCLRNDPVAEEARLYLAERGVEAPTSDRFLLGYAPDQWSWLLDRSRSTAFTPETLQACGLVNRNEERNSYYDAFRGRWMFPIRDTQQRVIAFGGRILPSVERAAVQRMGRSTGKYINSTDTPIFRKSDHLYGLDVVRDEVVRQKRIVIVEGYTDVVLTWQAGAENVAAVLGTALNENHLRLIKRFADQVVLVLDGDDAGQRRANEVLDLFIAADLDLRILTLPDGLDPCDFVQQRGLATFQELVDSARDALDHKLDLETHNIDLVHDTHRASKALDNILSTIAKAPRLEIRNVSAGRLREQAILAKVARRFHRPEEPLRQMLDDFRKQQRRRRSMTQESVPEPLAIRCPKHEIELLEALLAAPEKIPEIVENISPNQFVVGPVRELYEVFCHCYHSGIEIDRTTVMTVVEDARSKSLLADLFESADRKLGVGSTDIDQWITDVLHRFQSIQDDFEQQQLLDEIGSKSLSEEEERNALERIFAKKLAEQEQKQE